MPTRVRNEISTETLLGLQLAPFEITTKEELPGIGVFGLGTSGARIVQGENQQQTECKKKMPHTRRTGRSLQTKT